MLCVYACNLCVSGDRKYNYYNEFLADKQIAGEHTHTHVFTWDYGKGSNVGLTFY